MEGVESRSERMLLTLEEARQILGGISIGTLYNLRKTGRVTIVKLGRRSFIARASVDELVTSLVGKGRQSTEEVS